MIWHIAEGRHLRTLSQHKSAVVSISRMTDDGHSKLLSVSEDSFVIIWDWNTGEALREFRAGQFKAGRPGNPITAASFYEPAGTLCLGTHSGDLHLFALPPAQEDNTAREPGSYTVDITDDNTGVSKYGASVSLRYTPRLIRMMQVTHGKSSVKKVHAAQENEDDEEEGEEENDDDGPLLGSRRSGGEVCCIQHDSDKIVSVARNGGLCAHMIETRGVVGWWGDGSGGDEHDFVPGTPHPSAIVVRRSSRAVLVRQALRSPAVAPQRVRRLSRRRGPARGALAVRRGIEANALLRLEPLLLRQCARARWAR